MPKIFISYRRAEPDMRLAAYLQTELEKGGHEVFRDVDTPIGQRWAKLIANELSSCDYFVILISEQSKDRDMVRQEVQQVHSLNQKYSRPVILPVRLAYKGALPYDMAAWLDPLQYALWEDAEDDARIAKQLAEAISGGSVLPHRQMRTTADQIELIRSTEEKGQPLPKAEPVLDVLALTADNPFYVERLVDKDFYDSLRSHGGATTLVAPWQMGKSSLFARVRARLEKEGFKSAFVDLKMLAAESSITDTASAFEGICRSITEQLGLSDDPAAFFAGKGFVGAKLQRFLTKAVAPASACVVLLFDDIDSIFQAPFCDSFFGSLRSVIDQRAQNPVLQRISFGFAHSDDPGLWIKSKNQSPFNLGKVYAVPEFSRAEFFWLHQQHGNPLDEEKASVLFAMLGGQPYLTRLALFRISATHLTLDEIAREADADEGIFGDHLRARLMSVINNGLSKPFKSILDTGRCADSIGFQSLRAMGLVKGKSHQEASARFQLYHDYFKARLGA